MRIIGGIYKRRLIFWPDDINIRPTKDRIREAIFSALNDIENYTVLDLFAGSGSFGLEAISRGAKKVYFVDHNNCAIKCIKDNVGSLDIPSFQYEIIQKDSYVAIGDFVSKTKFDLIFLDPPYKEGKYLDLISYINEQDLLNKNGIITIETDQRFDFSNLANFSNKEYKYGEIFVYILRKSL